MNHKPALRVYADQDEENLIKEAARKERLSVSVFLIKAGTERAELVLGKKKCPTCGN